MTVPAGATAPLPRRLSTLDRLLPLWIGVAMAVGVLLGNVFPDLDELLDRIKIDTVSLPIALGLLAMMYPVLAKVNFRAISSVLDDRRPFLLTLFLNWVVGPLLMFVLAWVLLPDRADYRTGLVIVGLAPCIAMVIIWIDLANGSSELATVFVAINSVIQTLGFSALAYFYLRTLPDWLGLDTTGIDVSMGEIAKSVLIFLGVPLVAGFLTRTLSERAKGTEWYVTRFVPRIGPVALYGLLFTIVVLFALQGDRIVEQPLDVVRIAAPLLIYFAVMWAVAFVASVRLGLVYERAATVSFTAAGNNFELAIAVCIAVFGVTSGQALAGVVGPLIEVPALLGLVYVARWGRARWYPREVDPTA